MGAHSSNFEWDELLLFAAVEISGTSATLGTSSHPLTCALVGSSATDLQYQWSIGGSIQQPFSTDNRFFVFGISLSAARSDYSCEVRIGQAGATFTGTASLRVASEYMHLL